MNLIKYLGYGWMILLAAIVINGAVKAAGGATWYDYISNISNMGLKSATLSLHILEILFLFILYPGIFGLVVYLAVMKNQAM